MRDWRFGQAVQAVVARHANDFHPRHALPQAEPLAQRVLVREIGARHRLIDDDHSGRIGVVTFGEAAPLDERNPHQLVITRPDLVVINRDDLAWLGPPAFYYYRAFGDGVAEGGDPGCGGRLDAGQRLHPFGNLGEVLIIALVHGAFARFVLGPRVSRSRQI